MIATRGQVKAQMLGLLDDNAGNIYLQHVGGLAYPVTAGSVSLGIATLTVGTHSMVVGQPVTVAQITSSGTGNYNAPEVTLTAVAATTVSYPVAGSPVWVSGGQVQTGPSPFDNAFQQAYDALFQALLIAQAPRVKNIVIYTLATPYTTSLTPAQAGITDFADYVQLRERLTGSQELLRKLESRDQLTQRVPTDSLLEFVWREDTFYFVGATTSRDLEITYFTSGTAPAVDSTSIGIDGILTFLSNFSAGIAGPRKGMDETGARCMKLAVGGRYDDGVIGGELFRIIQNRVRSQQGVPVAPRPFTLFRGGLPLWRAPFIAAQQPQGVGTAPAQFSTANGTITGDLDGVNALFFLAYPVSTANIYRNGVLMTIGADCMFGANLITFLAGQIPILGDTITVEGWV